MSEPELYCESCDSVMAPDWSLPYCPMCGGKIGPKNYDRPEKPDIGAENDKAASNGDGGNGGKNAERLRSEAFDDLRQASPASIFIADILTLGLRSAFWLSRRMGALEGMARQDRRYGRMILYACFFIYIAVIALAVLTCLELRSGGWNYSILLDKPVFPLGAAGLLVALFLMNRHVLFWAKEVITDAIQTENADTISTKAESFAPSPFLLWFLGIPYLQSHLNEIVRARNLANFKSSKRRS